eukprot:424530-Pelagomonas_calceolata.AAC.1
MPPFAEGSNTRAKANMVHVHWRGEEACDPCEDRRKAVTCHTFGLGSLEIGQAVCVSVAWEDVCRSTRNADQVWGTEYIKAGKEFASDQQVLHMSYLKSTLCVKRTTTSWDVLRECGHEPRQFD